MPDKSLRQLRAFLRLAVWIMALRYGLKLLRLGWANERVLCGFAPRQTRFLFRASPWLPIRSYARLFRAAPLRPAANSSETERILGLRRQLNRIYSGYKPSFDPLSGAHARRLQAAMIRNQFQRLLHLRIEAAEAFSLAGYGSVGIAVLDFIDYASYFGWSVPLALPFQLFRSQVEMRHAKVSSRRSILLTLRALAGMHSHAGLLQCARAAWYTLELLLCRVYWEAADHRERRLRFTSARPTAVSESTRTAHLLRRTAAAEQKSLLALLAEEMLWHRVEELVALRAQMPKSFVSRLRFESALSALENNVVSILPNEFNKENEHVREVA